MLVAVLMGGMGSAVADVAAAKLEFCSGLPCASVRLADGRHVRLAIDLGDPMSILDKGTASALHLVSQPVIGPDHKPTGYARAVLPDATLAGVTLAALPVVVLDLKAMEQAGTMPDADGSLGYTAFREMTLSLDGPHRRLEMTRRPTGPCRQAALSLITFGKRGPPVVTTTDFAVGGKPVVVQLDTLFAGTLLIYPTAEGPLGLHEPQPSLTPERFAFTDGGVTLMRGAAPPTTFMGAGLGPLSIYFATKGVHLPDGLFDGTVGWALLRTGVAEIDFHNRCFNFSHV